MRGGEKSGERVGSKKELNTNGLQQSRHAWLIRFMGNFANRQVCGGLVYRGDKSNKIDKKCHIEQNLTKLDST